MVLVALYRYFYYRRQYDEALRTAYGYRPGRVASLGLPTSWMDLSEADLGLLGAPIHDPHPLPGPGPEGAGYLLLRLGDSVGALARFEKIAEIDTNDRIGIKELTAMARGAVAEAAAQRLGGNVRYLAP